MSLLPQCPVPTQETTTSVVAAALENLFGTWDLLCAPLLPRTGMDFSLPSEEVMLGANLTRAEAKYRA